MSFFFSSFTTSKTHLFLRKTVIFLIDALIDVCLQGHRGDSGLEGRAGLPGPRGELGLPGVVGERGPEGLKVKTYSFCFLVLP